MYALGIYQRGQTHAGPTVYTSAEIARLVAENREGHPGVMRHLSAIEQLEARGAQYSNQDFDVLSAAYSFAREPRAGLTHG